MRAAQLRWRWDPEIRRWIYAGMLDVTLVVVDQENGKTGVAHQGD
jgi:hypothetical protein